MADGSMPIGPFSGLDNVHRSDARTFQIPGPQDLRRMALAAAADVDLDDDGWPASRSGLVQRIALSAAKSMCRHPNGGLLVQAGGTILLVDTSDWSSEVLVSGLSSTPIAFHEHSGHVFWTNGVDLGLVRGDGVATNWGMTAPPVPRLGTTSGTLPSGRYRVACVYLDANGVMSGAREAAAITINGSQAITVNFAVNDANAAYVRIYASYADGTDLWFVRQIRTDALPTTITNVLESSEPLLTQFMEGPIPGLSGLASWGGYLIAWKDKFLIHSAGNNAHLFDLRVAAMEQDYEIMGAVGLDAGPCFVATKYGLYRYTGMFGAPDLRRQKIDSLEYAAGFAYLDASRLGFLQGVSGRVVAFASSEGLVIGLPDGNVVYPLRDRVVWDVEGKRTTITYREQGDLNQILVTLTNLTAPILWIGSTPLT